MKEQFIKENMIKKIKREKSFLIEKDGIIEKKKIIQNIIAKDVFLIFYLKNIKDVNYVVLKKNQKFIILIIPKKQKIVCYYVNLAIKNFIENLTLNKRIGNKSFHTSYSSVLYLFRFEKRRVCFPVFYYQKMTNHKQKHLNSYITN